ncbi:MAG: hypothetical protein AVDCRST_MAG88-2522 [uncultured Thermomicrobiales bacterium]|uniref:Uncharacterized protein n=1 Tax=uncultured Thermomicrobiales bacterium TaxID=1645740 RepID=A0A6J4VE20_9BACT|nr:MAG: hypothetical protein AVDCRST_MAG88-2522 [uncultured Thermomicrobiales bacterium]
MAIARRDFVLEEGLDFAWFTLDAALALPKLAGGALLPTPAQA